VTCIAGDGVVRGLRQSAASAERPVGKTRVETTTASTDAAGRVQRAERPTEVKRRNDREA